MQAISIRIPYVHLILLGEKSVECRNGNGAGCSFAAQGSGKHTGPRLS